MSEKPALIGGPIRVFIRYSHDSPEHANRALQLSNQLRSGGIDCHIDQYEVSPPEGWPAWMDRQISAARFVLVVCTQVYARRVAGEEEPGRGLGARWEGAIITQSLYDSGGSNEKFIPVVFSGDDIRFIPLFLRPVTRYVTSQPTDYESLYRHLTSQPRVVMPPLGDLEVLPPSDAASLAHAADTVPVKPYILLMSFGGHGTQLVELERVDVAEQVIATVMPASAVHSAFLSNLRRDRNGEVDIAFGTTGFLGRLKDAGQEYGVGGEVWTLTFTPEDTDYGAGFMEVATSGLSADDIAELRARRILLNEKLSPRPGAVVQMANDGMLEALVRGLNTPLQAIASPLPDLYRDVRSDQATFLRAARLLLVLYLRLAGVVEHVFKLDLTFESSRLLRVDFEGQRARKYSNLEPVRISVDGMCSLPTS